MKKNIYIFFICAAALSGAFADLFSPDRPVVALETKYFTFIFTEESRSAAEYLSGFADTMYEEIAAQLNTKPYYHIPVVMTPDIESLNGYYTWFPYPKIVLYQAATHINSSLGSFDNDLKKLFYHELTHAVSLTIRSGFENVIASIFGSPLGLSGYLAPMTFIEGVTVSYESLDGYGRTADPLIAAYIRQDILESRWKTFRQASGAYDLYPYGNLYYFYGGYFSRYLQKRFGMKTYAKLWRKFGIASLFVPLDKGLFSGGRFASVFGISLSEAWNDFMLDMAVKEAVYTSAVALRKASMLSPLASRGKYVYYADAFDETVYAYDTKSGDEQALFRAAFPVSGISVSPDGARLLISTFEIKSGFPKLILKEWDGRRLTNLPYAALRDAAYLPDGKAMTAIEARGYQTNLVTMRDGNISVILKGNETVSYASPVAARDGSLYVLGKEAGVTSVFRVRLDAAGEKAASVERLELPDSLTWVRYLSVDDEGVLRFSWDDKTFYRLAELRGSALSYEQTALSGGMHYPVAAGGKVYYTGYFSGGQKLCTLPADTAPLHFTEAAVSWKAAPELLETVSVYDAPPSKALQRYNGAYWFLPRFWLPIFSFDLKGFKTLGLTTMMADPLERAKLSLSAEWNFRANAVNINAQFTWSRFAAPIVIKAFDTFKGTSEGTQRSSGIAMASGYRWDFFSGGSAALQCETGVLALGASAAGTSPYKLWSSAIVPLALRIDWSDIRMQMNDPDAPLGYSLGGLARFSQPAYPKLGVPSLGAEFGVQGYVPFAALNIAVYGAAAALRGSEQALSYGPRGASYGGQSINTALYPFWEEFGGGASGPWYAQSEFSFRLLGTEVQKGLSLLYINRLSFRAGVRAFVSSGDTWTSPVADYGCSVFGHIGLTWSLKHLHFNSALELWCRPDKYDKASRRLPHGVSFTFASFF